MIHTQAAPAQALADFVSDVCAGLSKLDQKELPSKYFYDEVGSALFEVISVLPEYGLTRADERLLRRHACDIVKRLPSPLVVAELGSGNGNKTRWLIEELCRRQPTTYHPIEISQAALARCERELSGIDSVSIVGFERSYLDGLLEVAARRQLGEHLLVLFLGGTIGNFDRAAGLEFLREVRRTLVKGDTLLLGVDLEKPIPQLLLAYDDPIGATAAFNLNLLARINRELDGDFVLSQFQHMVRHNQQERRIEMYLRSRADQTVAIRKADFNVEFQKGETIWTENSHRYSRQEVMAMAEQTGFRCEMQWVDQEWPFAESFFIAC
ncbi:MAG TPA: L-histidine N(alpha)-methyltransferase [Acidobacteriota bacterium]|jgi:dimethylhistidine N-methyltransferase|nr:L-histidine N(alpha)-methyltransferase [Acidobacteriota bacterium]